MRNREREEKGEREREKQKWRERKRKIERRGEREIKVFTKNLVHTHFHTHPTDSHILITEEERGGIILIHNAFNTIKWF